MGVSVPASPSMNMHTTSSSPSQATKTTKPAAAPQPRWRPDHASDSCLCCSKSFSIWTRRHHCRACGELVCGDCSPFTATLPALGYLEPVRLCKACNATSDSPATSPSTMQSTDGSASDSSSDNELHDDMDDELVFAAVDVIASHSTHKHSKLSYEYFVQSEAVSWLMDAGILHNRSSCALLFKQLVAANYVTRKPWTGAHRSAHFVLSDDVCLGQRVSHYASAMHAETSKCSNCSIAFIAALGTAKGGFCSIDCKTNALINQADSARIRKVVG